MDWKDVKDWLPLIVMAGQGLVLWAMWSLGRKFMPRAECEECRKEAAANVANLGNHVADLATEAEVAKARGGPTSKDLSALEQSVAGLVGDVKKLGADLKGQGDLLQRVERQTHLLIEHHLKGGNP